MIAKHAFGHSGHLSARVLLGAAAFSDVTQTVADAALEMALSYGLNHVDTAASYGEAELRLGSWIGRHGKPFFLATKTGERTAPKAREEIHRSLERLRVDQIDLLQLHNLVDPAEWQTALGPGGALEAAVQAREEGLVRFIGVTGHGMTAAAMHYQALERFAFDSVLLPFSYVLTRDAQYLSDCLRLFDLCRARHVAVQTIKSIVRAPWSEQAHTRATWYRPLEEQTDIDRAVQWVLGHDRLFLNSAGDVALLPRVLAAAERFTVSPTDEDMRTMLDRLEMRPLFVRV